MFPHGSTSALGARRSTRKVGGETGQTERVLDRSERLPVMLPDGKMLMLKSRVVTEPQAAPPGAHVQFGAVLIQSLLS